MSARFAIARPVPSRYGQGVAHTEPIMKQLSFAVLAAALTLAACSSEPFGPLEGSWGGTSMQVTATRSSVVMALGCGAVVRIMHPVFVDGGGSFTVMDSLRGSFDGGAHDTLPGRPALAVSIVGKVTGDVLSITLPVSAVTPGSPTNAGYQTIAFDGRRGQPEDELVCRT
jgi:hypothetical protein